MYGVLNLMPFPQQIIDLPYNVLFPQREVKNQTLLPLSKVPTSKLIVTNLFWQVYPQQILTNKVVTRGSSGQ